MQDAPARIWVNWHGWTMHTNNILYKFGQAKSHITDGEPYVSKAECQRRIDAAVAAEIANASVMFEQTVADLVKALKSADTYIDIGHYEMARNITRNAIRARGQK